MNIKKQTPRLMSILLSFAMAFSSVLPAYATDVIITESSLEASEVNEAEAEGEDLSTLDSDIEVQADYGSRYEEIEVNYSQSSYYYVTIPKTITLGTDKKSPYSIKVEGDIIANKQVCIVPVDGIEGTEVFDFYMKDQTRGSTKKDVVAEVNQSKFYWNYEEAAAGYEENDNYIIADGLSAGSWKGNFQMEISMRTDPSHIHNYVGEITKEPTCTEPGKKTYICDCGDSYTDTIDPKGHHFEQGECTDCGEKDPNHEHHYTEVITKEPTCTEPGEKTYTCDCGDSYTEEIVAKGHHYEDGECTGCGEKDPDYHKHNYIETITKEPTCTEKGEKTYTCNCGDSYTETIDATGHKYVDGECEHCGEKDPDYHKHNYIETITKEPTCTEEGEKTYTCNCGDSYTETISATGHHYGEDDKCTGCGELNPNHKHKWTITDDEHTCDQCGESEPHHYDDTDHCDTCGGLNPDHKHEWIITEDKHTCEHCGESDEHDYNDKNCCKICNATKDAEPYIGTIAGKYSSAVKNIVFTNEKFDSNKEYIDLSAEGYKGGVVGYEVGSTLYILPTRENAKIKIAQTDANGIFEDCSTIISIEFNGIVDASETTSMEEMFKGCTNLKELNLIGLNLDNVETAANCFTGSNRIETISVPKGHKFNEGSELYPMGGKTTNWIDLSSNEEIGVNSLPTDRDGTYSYYIDSDAYLGKLSSYIPSTATTITFGNYAIPSTGTKYDLSLNRDGSVIGYLSGTNLYVTTGNSRKKIKLAQYSGQYTGSNGTFSHLPKIKSITFNGNVLDTSELTDMTNMFYYCPVLTSIDIRTWDTSNVKSMRNAFTSCLVLKNIYLSGIDTSNVTDMGSAFNVAYNGVLANIYGIEDIDVSNVENMSSIFRYCHMTSLDLSNWDTSEVKDMSYMFNSCSDLTALSGLENWNTENVTTMDNMFSGCSKAKIDGFQNWNVGNVKTMQSMFNGTLVENLDLSKWDTHSLENLGSFAVSCSSLKSANLANWDVSNLVNMSSMFQNDSKLQTIDFSNWNTESMINMSSAFRGCSALKEIKGIDNFDISKVTSIDFLFYGCSSLEELDLSNWKNSLLTKMSSSFSGCSKLKSLNISGIDMSNISTVATTETSTSVSSGLYGTFSSTKLQEVYLGDNNKVGVAGTRNNSYLYPDGNQNGKWIDMSTGKSYLYSALPSTSGHYVSESYLPILGLLSSKIPDSVKTIEFIDSIPDGVSTMDVSYAQNNGVVGWVKDNTFYIASNMEGKKTMIYYASFNGLANIESINFNDNIDSSIIYSLGNMFRGCSSLISLDLSAWDVSSVYYMGNAFYGCSSLQYITGTEKWDAKITGGGLDNMFVNCSSLKYIDLNNLDMSKATSLNGTFSGCNNLDELNISNWDTSNVTSMSSTFSGCGTQEIIDMVSDWNLSKVTTLYGCFGKYKGTKATVAFDAPALTNIYYLFKASENLQEVDLSGLTSRGISSMEGLFTNCTNLRTANINFYMGAVKYTDSFSQSTCRDVFSNCPNLEEIWLSNTNKLYHADVQLYPKGNKNGYWYNVVNGSAYKNTSMSGGGHFVADINMIKPALANLNGVIPDNTRVLNFTNSVAPTGKEVIDLSVTKDKKIVAWLEDDGYTLNISTQNNTGVSIESNEVFKGLSNIEEIYSNGYVGTDKCKDMSNMFSDCVKLNTLDLTGWNLSNVTNTTDMFKNTNISWLQTSINQSSKLNNVDNGLLPGGNEDGIWVSNSNDSEYTVGNLPNAADIYQTESSFAVLGPLQGKVPSGSKFIIFQTLTRPFVPNPNYEYIDVSKNQDGSILGYYGKAGYYDDNAFRVFAVKPNTKIRIIQKEGDKGIFQNTPMEYICYNDKVSFKGTTCTSYMFANCSNLKRGGDNSIVKTDYGYNVIAKDLSITGNIEKADHMFANCSSLTRGYIDIYSEDLRDLSYMFSNCYNLQMPMLGTNMLNATQYAENFEGFMYNCTNAVGCSVLAHNAKNLSYFFYGCKKLSAGNIALHAISTSANLYSVEDISYMYANSVIEVPIDFNRIDFSNIKNYTGIFQGAKITAINLPAGHPFNDKSSGLVPDGQANGYWYVAKSSTSYKAYSLPTATAGSYRSVANSGT